jgi:hypothetical protein
MRIRTRNTDNCAESRLPERLHCKKAHEKIPNLTIEKGWVEEGDFVIHTVLDVLGVFSSLVVP